MKLWIFVLGCDLIVPLLMIFGGMLYLIKPPKTMYEGYGYWTRWSVKSQEAWNFAHRHRGRLWLWCGIALLLLTVSTMCMVYKQTEETIDLLGGIICMLQGAVMIATLFLTERALKRRFGA